MKIVKLIIVLLLAVGVNTVKAQLTLPKLNNILTRDDATQLASVLNKGNIDTCFKESSGWSYCPLSETIRFRAIKCFNWLISHGADVNRSCDGYVPPLMHAAKYGTLDMVKTLIAKGADKNYQYSGNYLPADGQTPTTYAEKCGQNEIADYLNSLK